MVQMMTSHPLTAGRRRNSGFAMIEVLVAMFLIALWMLASAGTQISSLKFQKSAANRALAISLAGELSERIEANLAAAATGAYGLASTSSAVAPATDCAAVFCTPAQMANFDLAQWSGRVASTLPVVNMSVVQGTAASGLSTYTITLSWNERRGRQTYAETGDTELLSYVLTKTVRNVS